MPRDLFAALYRKLLFRGRNLEGTLRESAVVVAPHPDDEVLGCGGAIARKVEAGAVVDIVIMTDGRYSHRRWMVGDEMAELRNVEARRAAAALGVGEEHVHWMGFEDQSLSSCRAAAVDRLGGLLERLRPGMVFVPSEFERPQDHLWTNLIAREALTRTGLRPGLYEYPVWFWVQWPFVAFRTGARRKRLHRALAANLRDNARLLLEFRHTLDVSTALVKKTAALAGYRSQTTRLGGDEWPILEDVADGAFLGCFEQDYEIFRKLSG